LVLTIKASACAFYYVCILSYHNMSMNFKPPNPQRGNKVNSHLPFREDKRGIVENIGVEPMTSCVQGRRSSQLS
jgi:hypothetical protein